MFYKKEFANIIKKISSNYDNQRDFANKSGINRNYLSRYMNLKMNKPPKPAILSRLAEASCNLTTYEDLMRICGYFEQISGNRLKQAREEQHLSIEEVSNKLCIPIETLIQYENGNNYDADFYIYEKLASLYKINVAWLAGLVIEKQNEKEEFDNCFEFVSEDDAMFPLLDIGDIALIYNQNIIDDVPKNNKGTYLIIINSKHTIRKIVLSEDKTYYQLIGMNNYCKTINIPKDLLYNQIQILGKVIRAENKSAFK